MTAKGKNIKIQGDRRMKVPKSFLSFSYESVCSDRPCLFTFNQNIMQTVKRRNRYKFTITDNEIQYWKRIHELNKSEPSQKHEPHHIREYIVQTLELLTTDE